MTAQPYACPYCRTWFEGAGRSPRCPACGRKLPAGTPSLAPSSSVSLSTPLPESAGAIPPLRTPDYEFDEASATASADAEYGPILDFWDAASGAAFILLGAALFLSGLETSAVILTAVGAAVLAFGLYAVLQVVRSESSSKARKVARLPKSILRTGAAGVFVLGSIALEALSSCG